MSCNHLKPKVAVIALALLLSPLAPQSAMSQSPKRGKNGTAAKNEKEPVIEGKASDPQTTHSQDEPLPDASAGTREPHTAPPEGRNEDRPSFRRPSVTQSSDPAQDSPQSAGRTREGGAPPFDRPPLSRRVPAGVPDHTDSAPPDSAGRDGRRRPELQRPSDSRNAPRDEGPPVLRRPSDSRDPVPATTDTRQVPRSTDDNEESIKLGATLVNIPVLVSDRSGRYVPQLSARDFEIQEDGIRQEVAFFGDEEVPFNVVLLLDVSPSVQDSLEEIQDAALEFVRHLRSQDHLMVASFDRRIRFLTDMTNDRRELEHAIRSTQTGSGTSVYDAVVETVSGRLRDIDGRKALILFSDGEDTTSRRASYRDAIEAVTESDVLVYGLRYPSESHGRGGRGTINIPLPLPIPFPVPIPTPRRRPGSRPPGYPLPGPGGGGDFMSDIAAAGGGPVYDAYTISDLSRLARQITEELRHVYMLSYYPTNPLSNGGYRTIRVRVTTHSNMAVRHRRGYNARPTNNRPIT